MSSDSRVMVITGASSGIGEATARVLVAEGHRVALLARRGDRLSALASELGDQALAVQADVTDYPSLQAAAEQVVAHWGRVDVLINNAGVMLLGPFTSDQHEERRRMVEVNLLGAMNATEAFLEELKASGGDIVNISSVAGRTARSGNSGYAATKWGMNGWSEALRQELLPDVRVMTVEPGIIDSELREHTTDPDVKAMIQTAYDSLAIPAQDVGETIAFMLSRPKRMTINELMLRPTAQQ